MGIQSGGGELYGYDPANKRIFRRNSVGVEEFAFYGAKGEKLGVYGLHPPADCSLPGCMDGFTPVSTSVWFAGRLIMDSGNIVFQDRVGTNRASHARFYPYGEEITATSNDRVKFGTYQRDSYTGADYADQRYYASSYGRFNTPEPSVASASMTSSGTWNKYAYTTGDPVNMTDSDGRMPEPAGCETAPGDPYVASCARYGYQDWFIIDPILDSEGSIQGYSTRWAQFPTAREAQAAGGGGGGSRSRPECDTSDATNAKVISFITAHSGEARQLAGSTGLGSDFILAWAAYESGYGTSNKAKVNNNFFGLTGSVGAWGGSIDCPDKASSGFVCFEGGSGIVPSAQAAFFTPWSSHDYLGAALQAQGAGGNIAAIANAIASAGFNAEYSTGVYGNNVAGAAASIALRKDCP